MDYAIWPWFERLPAFENVAMEDVMADAPKLVSGMHEASLGLTIKVHNIVVPRVTIVEPILLVVELILLVVEPILLVVELILLVVELILLVLKK